MRRLQILGIDVILIGQFFMKPIFAHENPPLIACNFAYHIHDIRMSRNSNEVMNTKTICIDMRQCNKNAKPFGQLGSFIKNMQSRLNFCTTASLYRNYSHQIK